MIKFGRLVWHVINVIASRGPIGYYRRIHGGDLAAMIAFNALLALVPTLLLFVAVAGLLLRDPERMQSAVDHVSHSLPDAQTRDAVETLLTAKNQSTRLGLLGLIGLLWVGTSFVTTVA